MRAPVQLEGAGASEARLRPGVLRRGVARNRPRRDLAALAFAVLVTARPTLAAESAAPKATAEPADAGVAASVEPSAPEASGPGPATSESAAGAPPAPGAASDDSHLEAQRAFEAGRAAFDEGDYEAAVEAWERAYTLDPTAHALLLNLSRAHELAQRPAAAEAALRRYLELVPEDPDAATLSRRADRLAGASATPPRGSSRAVPLAMTAVGAATAIAGGVLWGASQATVDDFADLCGERAACPPDLVDPANAARDRRDVGVALTIAGGTLTAAGAAWLALTPRRERRVALVPVVTDGEVAVLAVGRF